ncbi:hypothetical protein A1D23_06030 [Chelonobacter oris]|nr:hypothetical protein [Chelonobacter oris]
MKFLLKRKCAVSFRLLLQWLFDTESRDDFIHQFQCELEQIKNNTEYHRLLTDFIAWTRQPHMKSITAQPLNNMQTLPRVVAKKWRD